MSATNTIQQLNRDLADKLIDEAKQNPNAFTGNFVGIANGKVVIVTDDLNELGRCLRQAAPHPADGFWFEVGRDYSEVIEFPFALSTTSRSRQKDTALSAPSTIQQQNRELAEKMNQETLRDPRSPNAGKMVGIANGQVVVVADNWDEVARQLRNSEPDPTRCFCIELGRDYTEVQEIWEVR